MRFNPFNLFPILLLIAFSHYAEAQAPQRANRPRRASISGQIAISGQPAANVRVTIVEVDSSANAEHFATTTGETRKEPETFTEITDAMGRYRLAGLAAGTYRISASSKAYVLANQNSDAEPAKWITLDGDEAKEDVDLSLARGGVITGRVTYDGRPLIATRVWLYAVLQQGERKGYRSSFDQIHQMFETDDRGVYRIYGLPAGRYVLSAGGAESYLSSKDPARNHRPAYFRDAASGNQPAVIEVKEGSEITDINIELGALKRTYEASGRLLEAETGTPIPQAQVYAQSIGGQGEVRDGPRDSNRDMRAVSAVTDGGGNFRLTDLTPGRYEVGYRNSLKSDKYISDSTDFEIVDDDVAGLEVKAIRAATISGVAVIEGPVDPNLRRLLFTPDAINVDTISILQDGQSTTRRPITEINPNGEFRVSVSRRGKTWKVYFLANQLKVRGLRVSRVELNGVVAPDGLGANPGEQVTGVRVVFTQASSVITDR
ncbi:MAG TPA: carboxypeptidase-like regulatory domain-containing protein [Blastocatellia bacterium]|nr:carboxypeptidase-like regulatory domain-containing protein [Blastocatellia bacterium]